MKHLSLSHLFLFFFAWLLPTNAIAQFQLAENGVTVTCASAAVGDTATVNGVLYTKRDLTGLKSLLSADPNNPDLATTCTSEINTLSRLFDGNSTFNQDISHWDVSTVQSMYATFNDATSFNQDISKWDVSSVTDMGYAFWNAASFDQDLSGWDVSSSTSFTAVFYRASSMSYDVSKWDISSATTLSAMFGETTMNPKISGWDVSAITDMSYMFFSNSAFNQDISGWDVSNVTDFTAMFSGAVAFNQDISEWDVTSATSLSSMFANTSFNAPIEGWDLTGATDLNTMFAGNTGFNRDIGGWDVSSVTDMSYMFWSASKFNQDIGNWIVSSVRNIGGMFSYAVAFNQDISGWDVSSVTNMEEMFLNVTPFNADISGWDVSNVKKMDNMLVGTSFSKENYSSLLTEWAKLSLQDSVELDVSSTYLISAEASRESIISTYKWTIRDLGLYTILSAPALVSPENGLENVGTLVLFDWNEVDNADAYQLQVATDQAFASVVVDSSELDSTSLQLSEPLSENTTFYWRVKALVDNTGEDSDWSEVRSFTTGIRTSLEDGELPGEFALEQNYPNPFNPTTQIRFNLPVATTVRLEVYTMLGQKVAVLTDGRMSAGVYTVEFDAGSLSSGTYIYRLTTPEFTQTRIMNLLK